MSEKRSAIGLVTSAEEAIAEFESLPEVVALDKEWYRQNYHPEACGKRKVVRARPAMRER